MAIPNRGHKPRGQTSVGRALRPPEVPVYRPGAVSVFPGGIGTRNLRVLVAREYGFPSWPKLKGTWIPAAVLSPAQQLTAGKCCITEHDDRSRARRRSESVMRHQAECERPKPVHAGCGV
jgi:hypothetical protein